MPSNNQKHFKLSDSEFEEQFAQCTIDPTLFGHEAHVRLTWIHLNKYGLAQTVENAQKQIYDFARFHNGEEKYHSTITVAAVLIIDHFLQKSTSDSFKDFISEFPQLTADFKALLGSHYSSELLHSDEAKFEYVEPDLMSITN